MVVMILVPVSYTHLIHLIANHLTDAGHSCTNVSSNMEILHVHAKGHKLDTLKQL